MDTESVRVALRRLSRGNLLIIADRAIELVSRAKLRSLVGDMIPLHRFAAPPRGAASVLDQVRKFHDASLRGEFFDSFNVNSKNFMDQSEGTEAFIAEFERLVEACVRATGRTGSRAPVREAFDRLFSLLHRLDSDPDSVVFFADEGGAWQVGVDWRTVLPAYFTCLAETATPEEYARTVDRVIRSFAAYQRPRHLAAARRVADAEQKTALRRLRDSP